MDNHIKTLVELWVEFRTKTFMILGKEAKPTFEDFMDWMANRLTDPQYPYAIGTGKPRALQKHINKLFKEKGVTDPPTPRPTI